MAMETIIFLHLIEFFGLQNSILHPEDSPLAYEYPAGLVDKKIGYMVIWDLADRIFHQGISYQDTRDLLERKLCEIPMIKDVPILEKKLHSMLPLTLLKSLRNEIIMYQLDNEIIATIELRNDEVHIIDARSSPRLHKYVTNHNKFAENLLWLQSFFFSYDLYY
jgi:hypothetical protein